MIRVLVVEDEPLVRALFVRTLAAAGYDAAGVGDAEAARLALRARAVDLVMLDLGLPGLDGLSFARELRRAGDVGLLVVSRRQTPEDRIAALDLGCDDYLVKPVHLGELCARAQAVVRRRALPQSRPGRRARFAGMVFDGDARTLSTQGDIVALTRGEFTILTLLIAANGGVLGREELCASVSRNPDESDLRTVDALVRRIRRKLEPHCPAQIIATAPGIGYRLAVPIEDI